jgi:PAP_fibrillin
MKMSPMSTLRFFVYACLSLAIAGPAYAKDRQMPQVRAEKLKADILQLATSFQGQGDPDRSKQQQLERMVDQLVKLRPQKPVAERLSLLEGAWKQVWGPYDYRSNKRGVDPALDVERIYQVVSRDGYYYNVNPDPRHDQPRIGLLRGEYVLAPDEPSSLHVRFTRFDQLKGCPPQGLSYIDLPKRMEQGELSQTSWLVPSFVVRWFFGKGTLREVYTDQDMRITYGSSQKDPENNAIYILKRVSQAPIKGC